MSRALSRRSATAALLALLASVAATLVVAVPPAGAYAKDTVLLEGHGWGHGRGLGQYGSLGYAIDEGRPYSWIVDHYYGGTTKGSRPDGPVSVRLTEFDNKDMILRSAGDYAVSGTTVPGGTAALVHRTDSGWDVSTAPSCGGPWTVVASLPAATVPEATTAYTGDTVDSMLNTCGPTGNVRAYRGTLTIVTDGTSTWVVNTVAMELYLRGVVPRESPASWADAGNGKGIEALKAQSVAARSYAWAENRSSLFKTCDTISCQVYGGAGLNGQLIEDRRTNTAIAATAGEVRIAAGGAVARTEFSSSTGGHTAGGSFGAVPDDGDDTATNANHDWTTTVAVSKVEEAFPSVGTLQSIAVTKRNGLGEDGGRVLEVKVVGRSGSVATTGDGLRSKLGLKSDWFTVVDVPVEIARLQGTDRLETSAAVSRDLFRDGTAKAGVIVSSSNYPDALVGVPLAVAKDAPILLSDAGSVPATTMTELQRATGGRTTVYLLGGTAALGDGVRDQLQAAGYTVVRYGGVTRYATAVLVAEALGNPDTLLQATGTGFPDALAAGTAAAKARGAVLLTAGPQQAPETAAYIAAHPGRRYAIGGSAAAADPAATAVAGVDRYATAVKVADAFFPGPVAAGLASGVNYPDALSGGVHAAKKGGPLLLTATAGLSTATKDHIQGNVDLTLTNVFVYGGTAAVADQVLIDLRTR